MLRKRKIQILIGVPVVIALLLVVVGMLRMDDEYLNPVEKISRTLFFPFQKGIYGIGQRIENSLALFGESKELKEENLELQKKISEMNYRLSIYEDIVLENKRIRELLGLSEQHIEDFEYSAARVIARSAENWHRSLILDKGEKDGLERGMAVLNHEGLIGRIVNTAAHSSEVFLITDRECAVGARVQETRQAMGVVEGQGSNSAYLNMIYISRDARVEPGDTIISSGLGGLFPPGVKIGKVLSVQAEENGLMQEALLEPFVDFSAIEEVLVITKVYDPERLFAVFEEGTEE